MLISCGPTTRDGKQAMEPLLNRVRRTIQEINGSYGYGDIADLRLFMDGRIEATIRRPHMNPTIRFGHIIAGDRIRFANHVRKIQA